MNNILVLQTAFLDSKLFQVRNALILFWLYIRLNINQSAFYTLFLKKIFMSRISLLEWVNKILKYINMILLNTIAFNIFFNIAK